MSSNVRRARETAAIAKSDQLDTWRAYADAMFALGLALGRGELAAMTYADAFALGHDTGLGARQETREIVRGIIDGYSAGCQARHRLVAELLHPGGEPCSHGAATKPQRSPSTLTPAAATTPASSAASCSPTPAAGSAGTGLKSTFAETTTAPAGASAGSKPPCSTPTAAAG